MMYVKQGNLMRKRNPIPKNIEYDILFKNDMSCCICRKNTGVVIHHIDENPSNNSIENLAVLCQEHHDTVHKKGGLTKKITPQILKKYKKQWEAFNENKRDIKKSPLHSQSKMERTLFEFEIRKTTYEFLSINDKKIDELQQKLEFLYSIHLLEDYSDEILKSLTQIIILISFSETNKSALIAENIHHYVWHLVGPGDVPLSKKYEKNLYTILEIMSSIGTFSGQFNKNKLVISNLIKSFYYVSNVSVKYNLKDFAKKIMSEIFDIKKKCKIGIERKSEFTKSIDEIDVFILDFKNLIKSERPNWNFYS